MILAPRKHLFATNIIFFCFIFILQKLITLFCIIERKACSNCASPQRCDARCMNNNNNHIIKTTNNSNNNKKHKSRSLLTASDSGGDHAANACVHVNTTMARKLKRIVEEEEGVDGGSEGQQQQQQQQTQQLHSELTAATIMNEGRCTTHGLIAAAGVGMGMPRRSMLLRMFGYGEGHYQLFVEDKQRKEPSKACLNAAVAELKLNPN